MSDIYGDGNARGTEAPPRTQPFMPADGPAVPFTERERERAGERDHPRDPVEAMREPVNRHKLALATAALTLLNTLLLLGLLASTAGDNGPEPIIVEGQPCLVVDGEETGTLYCRR